MSWRVAESLKKLREQINAAYPNRDKSSDGSIGDAAHASRSSDHNPWVKDARGQGVVTAIDIDADLSKTVKVGVIVDALIASKDPRIKYIIFNRRIIASYPTGGVAAWKWRPYSGVNAHTQHAHVSVNSAPVHYDSRADWNIGPLPKVVSEIEQLKKDLAEPGLIDIPPTETKPAQTAATQSQATDPAVPAPQPAGVVLGEVDLRKERPSSFVKVLAGFTTVTGVLSSLGIGLQTAFDRVAAEITLRQIVGVLIGVGLGALGLWFYDRSANRANRLNQEKIHAARDPRSNNVELTR